MKVIKKSENGFKLEGESKWFQVDKFKLINSKKFKELSIGCDIDSVKMNEKGFVIDFDPVSSKLSCGEEISSLPSKMNSVSVPPHNFNSDRAREILKGQCLNIAFENLPSYSLDFKDEMDKGIQRARKLFEKLEQSDYYNW